MALTHPYRQHNYMGEFASDAACTTEVQARKWDSAGNGTGTPQNGMWYYNTTSHTYRAFTNGAWASMDVTVKCSSNDTTSDYLENKITTSSGSNTANILETTTLNDGGNESVQIQVDQTRIDHNSLLNYSANEHFLESSIDHNNIQNKGTNTHAQIDSHIASTANPHSVGLSDVTPGTAGGDINMGNNKITSLADGVSASDAVNKGQLDAAIQGIDWQDSVLSIADATQVPPTEVAGDRYILDNTGASHANWDGAGNWDIVEFDGTSWQVVYDASTNEGGASWVEDVNAQYIHNGTSWVVIGSAHNHDDRYYTESEISSTGASAGSTLVGTDVTNFGGVLSSGDTSVQAALDTIDDHAHDALYPRIYTGAGNPNGSQSGKIGDKYLDTGSSRNIWYMNVDATNTGWIVV